jgi:hypothetical protein
MAVSPILGLSCECGHGLPIAQLRDLAAEFRAFRSRKAPRVEGTTWVDGAAGLRPRSGARARVPADRGAVPPWHLDRDARRDDRAIDPGLEHSSRRRVLNPSVAPRCHVGGAARSGVDGSTRRLEAIEEARSSTGVAASISIAGRRTARSPSPVRIASMRNANSTSRRPRLDNAVDARSPAFPQIGMQQQRAIAETGAAAVPVVRRAREEVESIDHRQDERCPCAASGAGGDDGRRRACNRPGQEWPTTCVRRHDGRGNARLNTPRGE